MVFFSKSLSLEFVFRAFLLVGLFFFIAPVGQAQGVRDLRKGVRKVSGEVKRTKRDINRAKRLFSTKKKVVNPEADTADSVLWIMKPRIPNGGMISDYEYIYTFLHREQELSFKKDSNLLEILYDSVNQVFYKRQRNDSKLKEDVEVIGWHPYWMRDSYKYYDFNLLSILCYYSYDVNPSNGVNMNPDALSDLRRSDILDSLNKYEVKLYLTVTLFGEEENHLFLSDPEAKELFYDELLNELTKENSMFSGIDLDFEGIPRSDKGLFTDFVKELSVRIGDRGYEIIIDVPYYTLDGAFEFRELTQFVKYFNVMAFEFNGVNSVFPGSVAPLRNLENQPSIETAVNDLLNVGVDAKKIILSLPLYGEEWNVSGLDQGLSVKYNQSLPYYKIKSKYGVNYHPYYDPFTMSYFYLVHDSLTGEKLSIWYENETSLSLKFKWATEAGVKGVGLWALGYENGAPEIWNAIDENFGSTLLPIEPTSQKLSGPYGLVKQIVRNKKKIGAALFIFLGFILLGFLLALFDWRVREVLFKTQYFVWIYSLAIQSLAIFSIQWWWNGDGNWPLVVGIIVGGIITFVVTRFFSFYRRNLR